MHRQSFGGPYLAFRISDFSISQLKRSSIGCRILDTALEYRSLQALSNFFRSSGIPLTAFTGVNISELNLRFISSKKVASIYILSPKKVGASLRYELLHERLDERAQNAGDPVEPVIKGLIATQIGKPVQ